MTVVPPETLNVFVPLPPFKTTFGTDPSVVKVSVPGPPITSTLLKPPKPR